MPRIEEMFAFVAEDTGPDDEGIVAFLSSEGTWMPLVGADLARVNSLRAHAQTMATMLGKPVKLLRFTGRIDEEVIEP
jgi:hypothetical protein